MLRASWNRPGDGRLSAALDPQDLGPQDALRRLRGLGPRRGRRQAHLLRPLRAPAPRPGVGRHRGQQRPPDPGLQGHGAGLAGLRRDHARLAQGPPRDRPLPLLDHRVERLEERPADVPAHRRRLDRAGPQRQPDQHPRAARDGRRRCRRPPTSSTSTPATSRRRPTTPAWSPRCWPTTPTPRSSSARSRCCRRSQGAFCFVWMNENTLYAARDPQGIRPLVLGRLDRGWVVASRGLRAGHDRRQRRPRGRARRAARDRRERPAQPPLRRAGAEGLRLRVRLPRPPRRHHQRPQRPRGAGRDGPPAGPRVPGRRRPGDPGARVGHAGRGRLRRGERHPVRPGLRQERLRRPDLHPAQPDPAPARHPAQAQRPRAHDPRQADRRRRRLDRARQHPARPGPDAARGRRARGPRPDLEPAGEVAVLLRHRLRHPRRADRQRARRSTRSPPASAPTASATSRSRAWSRRPASPRTALHGLLHRRVPDPAARREPARQAPPRDARWRPRRCPCSTTPDPRGPT